MGKKVLNTTFYPDQKGQVKTKINKLKRKHFHTYGKGTPKDIFQVVQVFKDISSDTKISPIGPTKKVHLVWFGHLVGHLVWSVVGTGSFFGSSFAGIKCFDPEKFGTKISIKKSEKNQKSNSSIAIIDGNRK